MSNVCDVLIKLLQEAGVKHIFGVPGDAINALTESIRKQKELRFVHVMHEEAGAFAAVGQAKLSGRLGVCAGTAGPGAIHLLNGLYDAKCDRAPVLAITGQVETRMLGSDYQQELDLLHLFKDVSVYNQMVVNPENFPYQAVQAIQAALEHRGVAHLNIPLDIAAMTVPHPHQWHVRLPGTALSPVHDDSVAQAAEILKNHKRVAILAGLGCFAAREQVYALAEKLKAPIVHALRAKELFPESHAYSVGGIGNLGIKPAYHVMEQCDALLMIGTDFPYVEFLPKKADVIQIDNDPRRIGKRIPVKCGIVGDSGAVTQRLLAQLEPKTDDTFLTNAQKETEQWRKQMARDAEKTPGKIKPQRLAALIGEAASEHAVFVCDTGEVTGWVARYLQMRSGQRFTVSGLLATMAFSLGAAIGAKLLYPNREVVAIAGDGGFAMLMADFSTAVKYKLPILFVIFNNGRLGMIQVEQEARGLPEYETDLFNPDYAAFARACGGDGMHVTDADALPAAIARGFSSSVPFILDVVIDAGEKIIPPHVSLKQAANYMLAKVKEMV